MLTAHHGLAQTAHSLELRDTPWQETAHGLTAQDSMESQRSAVLEQMALLKGL